MVDYGADPADNASDDRPAIQRAIDEAVPGDEVFFPNGVYNLNSTPDGLTNLILKSEVNLRGKPERRDPEDLAEQGPEQHDAEIRQAA